MRDETQNFAKTHLWTEYCIYEIAAVVATVRWALAQYSTYRTAYRTAVLSAQ